MAKERISYSKPSITDLEVSYATDAAKNVWANERQGELS